MIKLCRVASYVLILFALQNTPLSAQPAIGICKLLYDSDMKRLSGQWSLDRWTENGDLIENWRGWSLEFRPQSAVFTIPPNQNGKPKEKKFPTLNIEFSYVIEIRENKKILHYTSENVKYSAIYRFRENALDISYFQDMNTRNVPNSFEVKNSSGQTITTYKRTIKAAKP